MITTGQRQYGVSKLYLEVIGTLSLTIFVVMGIGSPLVLAQTYKVRHKFTGEIDGANPVAGLIRDSAGNLYGTTPFGGASGYGVVFKLDKAGETVLYSFTGEADGASPWAGLVRDSAGNLYGTTYYGGVVNQNDPLCIAGCGVVFKLNTSGEETVLYRFTGGSDGAGPGPVILDSVGNLYGTTWGGGIYATQEECIYYGCGVVFKLDTSGKKTVLYSFTGDSDGGEPIAGLVSDSAGNLYGTASLGGVVNFHCSQGCGVVFKLDTTGKQTVLYRFTGGADGELPYAGVVRDSAGNLYGTTPFGGASGYGVVFKLDKAGETVLNSFTGGADGAYPFASLIRDFSGNLYGITNGGTGNGSCYLSNCGVVFKLDTAGKETVLHSFTTGSGVMSDALWSMAGLVRDPAGNFFGTTRFTYHTSSGRFKGFGVVFKLMP